MLWRKELPNGKLLYVDIFNGHDSLPMFNQFKTGMIFNSIDALFMKNNDIAAIVLKMANDMQNNDEKQETIMGEVNKMICFAEPGSKDVGFAYGFRALCYFGMEKFHLCLNDIELARKNGHPAKSDLKEVERKCEEMLDIVGREESPLADEPKLSFPADEKIPCFAQGLEVKHSEEFGKHIVTNLNLEIGQTVIIEEAYCAAAENTEMYSQCANCFESMTMSNLIPCEICSAVMFCSQKCYDVGHDKFHAMECGKPGVFSDLEAMPRVVLRTVIAAIKIFPTVKQLMDVIEKFNSEKPHSELIYDDPSFRAYMQFFEIGQSMKRTSHVKNIELIDYAKTIHFIITSESAYKSKFRSAEASRFLAHLILHHIYAIDMNGIRPFTFLHGTTTNAAKLGTEEVYGTRALQIWAIYPNSSQLNHSCQPNIARIFTGNKLVGKVIRPINRGEQLFVTYIDPLDLLKTTVERNRLISTFHFERKCDSCELKLPPFQSNASVNVDISLCRLFNIFSDSSSGHPFARCLIVNKDEMMQFEKSAITFLQSNEHLHPTRETVLIQFLLMQIWQNNLGR